MAAGVRMRIGLIDVDGHNYPNLPLMKLSAYYKNIGHEVEWYDLMKATNEYLKTGKNLYQKVFMSKVFSFTNDYENFIFADEVVKGGTGYCISLVDGKEEFDKRKHFNLPDEIEHTYPDYELYGIKDKSYGFLTRGCPRGCFFCHVGCKEGLESYKVADLNEFWNGQKNIELMDPNTLACREREDLLKQLIDSKAKVEFNQGLDIRMMDSNVIELLNQIKLVNVHFAWDRYQDKELILPKFENCLKRFKVKPRQISVYVLTNYNTSFDQDLERVMILRSMGYCPYIMRYNKESIPKGHELNKLARWCNNRAIFWKHDTFTDYLENSRK